MNPDTHKFYLSLFSCAQGERRREAFTLMELIAVVIIVGAMAAFAIPNFTKSLERSYEQDANIQLSAIHSANKIYFARENQFWPPDNNGGAGYDVDDINANLALNILENDMTYNCTGTAATFTCTATRNGGSGFVVTVTEADLADGVNPSCAGCP